MDSNRAHVVQMGGLEVKRGPAILSCIGLGSCLGVIAYDSENRIGGMANVMLPTAFGTDDDPGTRYANVAVPGLVEQMVQQGADSSRIKTAIVGGAQVFKSPNGASRFDIGTRNRQAVVSECERLGVPVVGEDTGGDAARTVYFDLSSGLVVVRTAAGGDKALCRLS